MAKSTPSARRVRPSGEQLSQVLRRVLRAAEEKPMLVRDMVSMMRGRGLHVIVIFLCLPFLSPVAIPGVSIPFGLAIAVCGLRIATSRGPWLPGFIMNREVSYKMLRRLTIFGCKMDRRLEKLIHPRWPALIEGPVMTAVIGGLIAIAGILLSLPIPPPFPLTNTIPGFAIIFLCFGLMERDGALVPIGGLLTLFAACYIGAIFFLGKEGAQHLWKMLGLVVG